MSAPLFFSLPWGLRSLLLLVKPAWGVGLHCWASALTQDLQQGWGLGTQHHVTQMAWVKKWGWEALLLSRLGLLWQGCASHCVQDLWRASGPAKALGAVAEGTDRGGWGPNTSCASPVWSGLTGSETWACFNLGTADSSALPASSQKLAWTNPAWLEIQWDLSAVGIGGTLFSIVDPLWLNVVVMRPDLLLCSPCFALHNGTNIQRESKFDPCFLRIVKFSFCTNFLAEFEAWFIKRAFPLRVNVIALSVGLQDKCS